MKLSNFVKGILSLIGGFAIYFIFGTVYSWSATNAYYASYLINTGGLDIKVKDAFFFMPMIWIGQYMTMAPGLKLGIIITVRGTVIVAALCIASSFVLLLYIQNFALVIASMFLFGVGIGLAYLSILRNLWKYFPERTGLVNGIILAGVGFSSAVLNPIADYMINPNNIPPNDKGIYPIEVSNKIINFFHLMLIIIGVLGTISIIFTIPYYNPNEEPTTSPLINNNPQEQHSFKEGFCSIKNLQLSILCFTSPFFLLFMPNIARTVGNLNKLDQYSLQIMSFTFSAVNGCMRFLWGYLYDLFGFKPLMCSILLIQIAVGASIYFIAFDIICYFAWNMAMSFALAGVFVILAPTFNKVFGIKEGADIFGVSSILIGVTSVMGPILTQFVIKGDNKDDYLIVFMSAAGIALIGLIDLLIFKEELYVYDNSKREDNHNQHDSIDEHMVIPQNERITQ